MRKLPRSEAITIDGPAGNIEGLFEAPQDRELTGCAVVCHPLPTHGGTMHNKVTHTLARSFVTSNMAALRFNFRGVGKSAGEFDHGNGEVDDIVAAVEWLRGKVPHLPLWLAGFSFGAALAVRAALKVAPAGLISIAPAVSRFANSLDAQPHCPWLIVQGDQDELVDLDETIEWFNSLDPGPELQVFPDTGHFFHGKLVALRSAAEAFIAARSEST
ncbi:MAG: alpha/beta hydrolase [Gammaproteobacteria bacterium]|nr:alpha/beta hydrolase [Gammaproteobacteria bacterium]